MTQARGKKEPYGLETMVFAVISIMGAALSVCLHMFAPASFAFRTSVFMTLSVMALTVVFAVLNRSTREESIVETVTESQSEAEGVIP